MNAWPADHRRVRTARWISELARRAALDTLETAFGGGVATGPGSVSISSPARVGGGGVAGAIGTVRQLALEPRELGQQQRSLPRRSHELVPTPVPTFPWRRETPGYAMKRSTYWIL